MKTSANNFNLAATIESGQIFRWEKIGEWYFVVSGSTITKIRQIGNEIEYYCSHEAFDVENFIGLKTDYSKILYELNSKEMLRAPISNYFGLRILNQEPWECTASFICSQMSNIKRIRKNLNSIAENYGEKISFEGYESYSFPAAEEIALDASKLKLCNLGYREKYIAETAKAIANGFDFESARNNSYENAKAQLMQLPGIGGKVADCILLFSLGFMEAFPVDVWMIRAMKEFGIEGNAEKIAAASRQLFGENAGYAQQFIYHHARNKRLFDKFNIL